MTFVNRRCLRRGSVMPLMAVILFLFVTFLALVVDFGVVLVNRRQMQSTANSAALDALRGNAVPTLAPNPNNSLAGDLVRGNYSHSQNHFEDAHYERLDFAPVASSDSFDAVLARVRKTGESDIDGGTAGPRLPYHFRRGVTADFSTQQGVAIRATAIAHAQRAKVVGVANPAHDVIGATDFALVRDYWDGLSIGTNSLTVDGTALKVLQQAGSIVGVTLRAPTSAMRVTDAVTGHPWSSEHVQQSRGYVPIVIECPQSSRAYRIIGFGYVESISLMDNTLSFSKRTGHVAEENASAQFLGIASEVVSDPALKRKLLESHDRYWDGSPAPFADALLAPALVRATD